MITDTKLAAMHKHIGLRGDLRSAKARGVVETAEEEEVFLRLEKEIKGILAGGGRIADFGFTDWTED